MIQAKPKPGAKRPQAPSTPTPQKAWHTQCIRALGSIKLTIALLIGAMLLVFFGTLDQVSLGIFEVQKRYFESLIAFWSYPSIWPKGELLSKIIVPLPGGYLLGSLFLINIAASWKRLFRFSKKKLGITIIHLGVLLLVVSGFLTSVYQEESQMTLNAGTPTYYSQNMRESELVLIDKSFPDKDRVVSIPASLLKDGQGFKLPNLPFSIRCEAFYPNADLGLASQNPHLGGTKATEGAGARMGLVVFPKGPAHEEGEVNAPSAYITLKDKSGALGTWLVSSILDSERFPSQTFTHEGKPYEIAMRFKRIYYPFSLELLEFTHENHPGTDIPKFFSSLVQLRNPALGEDRQTLIFMNNPLRYQGSTFYQASFIPGSSASILQVVQNKARTLPYVAVFLVGLGMLIQFLSHLIPFLKKNHE